MVGDHNRSLANKTPCRRPWNGTKFLGIILVLAQVTIGFGFPSTAEAALDPCATDLSTFQFSSGTTLGSSSEVDCTEDDAPDLANAPDLATIIASIGLSKDQDPSIDTAGIVETLQDAITLDPGIDTDALIATAVALAQEILETDPGIDTAELVRQVQEALDYDPGIDTDALIAAAVETVQDILRYDPGIDINQVIQNAKDQADVCGGNPNAAASVDCQAILDNARDQVAALLAQWLGVVGDCTGGSVSTAESDSASSSNAPISCSELKILANQMVDYVLNLVVPAVGQVAACLNEFANPRATEASSSEERIAGVDCGQARGLLDDTITETSAWAIQFGTGLVNFLSDCAGGGGTWDPAFDSDIQAGDSCSTVWSGIDDATSALGSVLATVNDCNSAFGATGNPAFPVDPGQGESLVACGDALREVAATATDLAAFAAKCINDVVRAEEAVEGDAGTPGDDSEREFTAVDCAAVADAAHALVAWTLAIVQPHIDDAADCATAMAGTYGDAGGTLNCQDLKQTALDLVDQWLALVLDYAPKLIDYLESCASDGDQAMPVPNEETVTADGSDPCGMTWDVVHPVFGLLDDIVATAGDCAGQNNLASVLATQEETGEPLLACGQAIADLQATLFGVASYVAQCAGDATGAEEFYAPATTATPDTAHLIYVQPDCEDFGQPRTVTLLEPCNIQDADSDLVPRADVCAKTYTFDPRAKATSADQGSPQLARTGIGDPDDTDPTNPVPDLDESSMRADAGVCDDDADAVCYDVGLCYTHMGTRVCRHETGRVESGLLPLDLPAVPTGLTLGPDNDGDGLPVGFVIEQTKYRIESDGRLNPIESSSSYGRIDTDDGDRNNPVPHDAGRDLIDEAERLALEALECAARSGSSYQACLESTCDDRFQDQIACDIYGTLAPEPCFTYSPSVGNRNEAITFDATCTEDPSSEAGMTHAWDWQDDGAWDQGHATSETASHAFSSSGFHSVRMEAKNALGLASSTTRTVPIDDAPVACFTAPTRVAKGRTVSFDPTCTSDDLTSNRDLALSWDWDGDGTTDQATDASQPVNHIFTSFGAPTVRMSVSDSRGQSDETQHVVEVVSAPVARLDSSVAQADEGEPITFSAASSSDELVPETLLFDWDLDGDGTYEIVDSAETSHTTSFNGIGNHLVRIRVTNGYDFQSTATKTVFIDGPPSLTGSVVVPDIGIRGIPVEVSARVDDPGKDTVGLRVDWGDGSTSNTPFYASGTRITAKHTYGGAQDFCVRVRPFDADGNLGDWSACQTIDVDNPIPTPQTGQDRFDAWAKQTVTVYALAEDPEGDDLRYVFEWDDGTARTETPLQASGTAVSVQHAWNTAGDYCLKVQAIDTAGHASPWSSCVDVFVTDKPTDCMAVQKDGLRVTVDASCAGGAVQSYTWSFDDGSSPATTTGSQPIKTHEYLYRSAQRDDGKVTITVEIQTNAGSVKVSRNVAVGPSDDALAQHWAPVFYQDTDSTDYSADQLTNFDFDGNWIGNDNWENEPHYPHPAYVYYHLSETDHHYYIGYMVFHPRDWVEGSGGYQHENDMEGALLMIAKRDTRGNLGTYGFFEAVITMAHNEYEVWFDDSSWQSARLSSTGTFHSGTISMWQDSHIELEIEAKGHGIFSADNNNWKSGEDPYDSRTGRYRGDYGTTYYPGTSAEVPFHGNDRDVRYRLVPIDALWDRRDHETYTETYAEHGAFRGGDGGTCNDGLFVICTANSAHAPWAMFHDTNPVNGWQRSYLGLWFEMPARLFDRGVTGQATDQSYGHRSTGGAWESFHTYQKDRDYQLTWEIPGARAVIVDLPRLELAPGDRFTIRDGKGNIVHSFESGGSYLFSVGEIPVHGSKVTFEFWTDGSKNGWGYMVDVMEAP